MIELLKFALETHGGLERWTELTEIKADLSVTVHSGKSEVRWTP